MDLKERYVIEACDMRGLQGAVIDIVRFLEEKAQMDGATCQHILAHINVEDKLNP
ncbi:hypothetical protein N9M79_00275 [Alphaproteobacteria bacterium]|nr:hypothetical protein [Alphaproteobacteria bacterium]MDB2522677.1 hypothetical protein [Alphaproteobacteria bacterium]